MSLFLLILLVLPVVQSITFDDGIIYSNADFKVYQGYPTLQLNVAAGTGYLVYAVSAGSVDYNLKVNFSVDTADLDPKKKIITNLNAMSTADASGRLPALAVDGDHTKYKIIVKSDQDPPLPAMVFYFVRRSANQQGANPPPVYDATAIARTITSDNSFFRPAMTFLSAAPRFTLHTFNIGAATGMKVYTVGWESVIVDNTRLVEPVLTVGSPEAALKSFVTITGPIATVVRTNPGAGKYAVAVQNDVITDFQPGSVFAFPSPGFISSRRAQKYETFFKGEIDWDYTSGTEVPSTISVKINDMKGGLAVTTVTGGASSTKMYKGNSGDVRELSISEVKVFYSWKNADRSELVVFLVHVTTTKGAAQSSTTPAGPPGPTGHAIPTDSTRGGGVPPTKPSVETTTSVDFKNSALAVPIMILMAKLFL